MLFRSALAPSTLAFYRRVWNDFALFLGSTKIHFIQVPFVDQDVLRFVAFLFNGGMSYSSILSYLSALTYWIRYKNWPLVTRSFVVTQALRGVRALSVGAQRHKFPVTPDILRSLCNALLAMHLRDFDSARLKAMFLLSYYAFLRVGELCGSHHALLIHNVHIHISYILIHFPSYKFSAGRCPSIFLPAQSSDLCPVKALSVYISLRGHVPGPLFLNFDGSPCTIARYRSDLARVVACAGLSSFGITPHSFRIGAATAAAAIGIPEETIQRMGRWSSRAFIRYIKFQINRL